MPGCERPAFPRARPAAVVRRCCLQGICRVWFEVGWVALCAQECVERDGDDVTVLDGVVRVVPADPPLELESVGD